MPAFASYTVIPAGGGGPGTGPGGGGGPSSGSIGGDPDVLCPIPVDLALVGDIKGDGIAQIISQYECSEKLKCLIETVLCPIQGVEQANMDVYSGVLNLENAEGAQLDVIGALLGIPRNGMTDAQYLLRLKVQQLVLNSGGTIPDLLAIAEFQQNIPPGSGVIVIEEQYPHKILICITAAVIDAQVLLDSLEAAKAAGVQLTMIFTTGLPQFCWSPTPTYSSPQHGFGSVYDATVGGELYHVVTGL